MVVHRRGKLAEAPGGVAEQEFVPFVSLIICVFNVSDAVLLRFPVEFGPFRLDFVDIVVAAE
ncbi:hypothetical protein [Prevotella pectinovora]|uniref:hypothetical protein n=1 Tax=Prevotella pectinovora TaxID=1602169 RepID=UPI002596E6B9|nr:hypothetical protein [uncultured Prevotella sp.]